eukprot:TRINITY_DN59175_c0_g1_i1.p1 TRINITY_DN59175_c0_g1~~TRINITY_DN59175_c0_g1_i1.p1  ORF type:complete len:293 (-),score=42.69 TRINITY_DN59175_c0_g1_i1:231-1109(-)
MAHSLAQQWAAQAAGSHPLPPGASSCRGDRLGKPGGASRNLDSAANPLFLAGTKNAALTTDRPSNLAGQPEGLPRGILLGTVGAAAPSHLAGQPGRHGEGDASAALKLAVFDFDQTLASEHLYFALSRRNLQVEELSQEELVHIFGGQNRLRNLDTFLQALWGAGVALVIVSHGNSRAIQTALHRVRLLQYFRVIYGSDSSELQDVNQVKVRLIRRLRDQACLAPAQVLFCDDDVSNIEREVQLGDGQRVTAAQVCRTVGPSQGVKHGITEEHMKKILSLVGQRLLSTALAM